MGLIFSLPYPISTNRYWRTSRNVTHISEAGRKFKQTVRANYQWITKPTDKSVAIDVLVHPKLTKKGVAYKTLIDLDNCTKCVLDSLIGIAYHDDEQVKDIRIRYGVPMAGGATTVTVYDFSE